PTTPPVTAPPTTPPVTATPPAPPVTATPTPTPAPTTPTGSSRGSAGQGAAAVAWATGKLGLEYIWGATGPNAYDCSGLTSQAWSAAGVNITRTSRSQYDRVQKVSYNDLRPGDLIFWASDTSDASTIHHVALYAGGGQIIEASKPGVLSRQTAMRWADTMPYAGRP
ncbi:MAG: C40 family peptidase, partial [Cellulomonas sp.]|nr:C40 family peptidase [Cellulomonas sp.]